MFAFLYLFMKVSFELCGTIGRGMTCSMILGLKLSIMTSLKQTFMSLKK